MLKRVTLIINLAAAAIAIQYIFESGLSTYQGAMGLVAIVAIIANLLFIYKS